MRLFDMFKKRQNRTTQNNAPGISKPAQNNVSNISEAEENSVLRATISDIEESTFLFSYKIETERDGICDTTTKAYYLDKKKKKIILEYTSTTINGHSLAHSSSDKILLYISFEAFNKKIQGLVIAPESKKYLGISEDNFEQYL